MSSEPAYTRHVHDHPHEDVGKSRIGRAFTPPRREYAGTTTNSHCSTLGWSWTTRSWRQRSTPS